MLYKSILTLFLLISFQASSQEVDAGNGHSLILDENGVVWAAGRNNFGQLGDGSLNNASLLQQVPGLPKCKTIARGYDHSLAIDVEGNLWAWGLNNYGQLGIAKTGSFTSPIKLNGHSNFVKVEGGHWHTLALKEDGSVWGWGHNFFGELGNGSREHTPHPSPVRIEQRNEDGTIEYHQLMGISDIKSVGYHTLALDSNGHVYGWGSNTFYQLHPNKVEAITYAKLLTGIPKVQKIATGWHHSVILDVSGKLWMWGSDPSSQHEENISKFFPEPVELKNLPKMKDIACGSWHTLALDVNGELWGWGKNHFGMLGLGDTISHTFPVKIEGLRDICSIGAGCFQSIVTDKDGVIWMFGDNPTGQLSVMDETRRLEPVQALLTIDGKLDQERIDAIESERFWKGFSLNNLYKLIGNHPVGTISIVLNLILFILLYRVKKKRRIISSE